MPSLAGSLKNMTRPLRAIAVSGGLQRPSRAATLAMHLLGLIGNEVPCEQHLVELGVLAPHLSGAIWRTQLPVAVERELVAVEQADILVVVTPVFRGSYTGLFKHFFDFIGQDALVDKPVLLAATGGSERHALMIDHQLRPLFSFFQARTLPLGVYATEADYVDYQVRNEALIQRTRLAIERAMPLLDLTHGALRTRVADVVAA